MTAPSIDPAPQPAAASSASQQELMRTDWLSDRGQFDAALGDHLGMYPVATAVLMLELMDLPDIAGIFGRRATPAIVAEAGHRFLSYLAPSGTGPAARLGESRFVTVVAGVADREQAYRLARRLCRDMARPIIIDAVRLAPTFCVGVSYYDGGSETPSELADQAETALAEARRHGPGSFCLFSPDMEERMRRRMLLREPLQRAIERHELRLHYQPIVDLTTGRIEAIEALARWHNLELGAQSPADFIAIAEASGLIVQLGAQMLLLALKERAGWREAGLAPPPVSVNVSARQLHRPGFVETVTRALAEANSVPEELELELTEGTLIETTGDMLSQLALLSRMGVTLTVDDFGTGYSSLRYLRDLPVRKLKIDQYFIRDIARDPRDLSIVRAIVAMAGALELEVIAEGIENEAQRASLVQAGCRIGQGYLFDRPMSGEEFAARLVAGSFGAGEFSSATPPPASAPPAGSAPGFRVRPA